MKSYTVHQPTQPSPRHPGFLDRLLPRRRAKVEQASQADDALWRADRDKWAQAKSGWEQREATRKYEIEVGILTDEAIMERMLEERLTSLEWPRETDVSYQLANGGEIVGLDIDLPEIEDLPTSRAEISVSGYKFNIKPKSATQLRKEYMQFIHAILFRAIGETFYTLPTAKELIASGYSQRTDPATGQVRDDYLLSVRVKRDLWQVIDFTSLDVVDLTLAFGRFDLVRDMTKTGLFKPVTPLNLDL